MMSRSRFRSVVSISDMERYPPSRVSGDRPLQGRRRPGFRKQETGFGWFPARAFWPYDEPPFAGFPPRGENLPERGGREFDGEPDEQRADAAGHRRGDA